MEVSVLLLAIHRLGFLRTKEKTKLFESLSDVDEFLLLSMDDISIRVGRVLRRNRGWNPVDIVSEAEKDFSCIRKRKIGVATLWDIEYPALLREVYNPPFMLFYLGCMPDFSRPPIAIVGTRRPDKKALNEAFRLGMEFAGFGIPVVSGLALGIDGAAHSGCVRGGGVTAAVLGCGVNTLYPSSHKELGAAILRSGGIILSEYPPRQEPLRHQFPQRNRIISGLSRGCIIVQAPAKSGALITGDFALEQGRDVYVFRDCLEGGLGAGCAVFYKNGASSVNCAKDVLDDWGINSETIECRSGMDEDGLLLELLEEELEGRAVKFNGVYFRRL